ncbi:Hypothetical protein NTJ_12349 [Nesidiocoris tenuis]|uniref:Uncharacterized protein n=1 Tax=Nesidiocoris tenuis TaxID=355587 RepID=A0ABN7B541_9HEMI|nr:Hypothetical protein NTJ_12349 [Nesidiocoris tenuis]
MRRRLLLVIAHGRHSNSFSRAPSAPPRMAPCTQHTPNGIPPDQPASVVPPPRQFLWAPFHYLNPTGNSAPPRRCWSGAMHVAYIEGHSASVSIVWRLLPAVAKWRHARSVR